ncbi:glycoside hydrolase/deacetylase [Coprinellus micaceus]|uniref:chitin deacetylase n=1 Tax=Coprinellus micaceus TaxID=71717 RepID=A0A4Y7SRS1_COPMI|nr:glycoside hydrolase/deacetylase [Coprinellus micaceus]
MVRSAYSHVDRSGHASLGSWQRGSVRAVGHMFAIWPHTAMSPLDYYGSRRCIRLVGGLLGLNVGLALAGSNPQLILREHSDGQCKPYYYAPVNTHLASFPTIWEPAYILRGDTNAEDKWDSIKHNVPNISTKGTPNGDFSKHHYPETDDDCWWTYSKCVNPKLDGLPNDIASVPEPHTLAYGFDDGPNCSHNAFYDYLVAEGQKATMFYIGSNVMDWPLEAQRAVSDGHEICVHTWSHRYMTGLGSREVFAELYYTIKLVANVTPTCWRPPFGDVDNRVRAIAHGLGLRTILWKYDSNDWKVGTGLGEGVSSEKVDANYEHLIGEAERGSFDTGGAILLAHELNNFTMSEAVKYYERLKSSFKNLVPLAVALNNTHPYVEDTGSLGDFREYTEAHSPPGSVSNATPGPDDETFTEPPDPTDDQQLGGGGVGAEDAVNGTRIYGPPMPFNVTENHGGGSTSSAKGRMEAQGPILVAVAVAVLVVFF